MTQVASVATPELAKAHRALTPARVLWWLALLTIVAGVVRITATYPVLSATYDEPAHIAAGMQLLDKDEFTYERLHPPLSRVAAAIGPFLAGYHSQNGGDMWIEGRRLLHIRAGQFDPGLLTLARLGILPFFVASLLIVWVWGSRNLGQVEAALAVIMLGTLPVFLAHAGLATTDAAFAATFAAAFFSFLFWLERPSALRGFLLGAAIALALCTKLSALLFIPASFAAVLAYRWLCEDGSWRPMALLRSWHRCLAPLAAFLLTVWIVFGCKADPLYGIVGLIDGVRELTAFADGGAPSYFLGEINAHGSWAFFPVLLVVKSPIPFLVAVAIGAAVLLRSHRRDWRRMAPLIGAAAIIASVIPSSINMGLRHLLPVFPLLALVAGAGLARLLTLPLAPLRLAALGLILAWQTGESAAASPDYLAYFNQLGRGQPERIVAGSDLDWGQDIGRLVTEIRQRRISSIRLALHTSADLSDYGFPAFEPLYPGEPATGWVAVSEQMRAFYCAGYRWLDTHRPVARIGASIRLYYIADGLPAPAPENPDRLRSVNWSLPLPCPPAHP